jgi:hypothetical protein
MRATIAFLVGIVTAVVVSAYIMLVAQDTQRTQLTLVGGSFSGAAGWLLAGSAVVGFVLALLIALPGRFAAVARYRALGRRFNDSQDRLTTIREKYAELHGDYGRLFEEHERLMSRIIVTAALASQQAPAEQSRQSMPAGAAAMRSQPPAASSNGATAQPLRRTGPLYPPGHPPQLDATDTGARARWTDEPSLLDRAKAGWERIRARLRRQPDAPAGGASDDASGPSQDTPTVED